MLPLVAQTTPVSFPSTTLYRKVGGRGRYYTLRLVPTLFGEVMLERIYGSVGRARPTGEIKEVFERADEAFERYLQVWALKGRKGYR